MKSVVPILNSSLFTEIELLKESLEYLVKDLGHEVVWLTDRNALSMLQSTPLEMRIAFIVRLIHPKLLNNSQKMAMLLQDRFITAYCIEDKIEQVSERILALDEGCTLVGKRISRAVVRSAIHYIYSRLDQSDLSVEVIASGVNLSKKKLEKEFLEEFGEGVWHTVIALRINEAKRMLVETDSQINEIGIAVGIIDPSIFTRTFVKTVGVSPRAFRKSADIRKSQNIGLKSKVFIPIRQLFFAVLPYVCIGL